MNIYLYIPVSTTISICPKRFFKALDIPKPDINFGVGSGTHAEQVGKTMLVFEKVLRKEKPDWVVAYTDSGGLQEECTVLGTPCLTLRWNT